MALGVRERLGHYEILGPLGSGGMGEVYRARDTRLGRDVALKVLPPVLAGDPHRRARFDREARAASALSHPNIVVVHDVGSEGGTPYVVMELVEGRTLRELLASGPLPVRGAVDVAVQVAEGLVKAHGAGIVHRDLKPENLAVSEGGAVKILDFGLAKLDATPPTEGTQTDVGAVMGTVGYMSPEQASGKGVDYRSDQFSLGAILYEAVTGQRAFRRETAAETLSAIIREDPPPVSDLMRGVPEPLAWIIERCLSKSPGERYASTDDLARDLSRVRGQLASGESIRVARRRRQSTRRRALAAAVTLSVAVVAGTWSLRSRASAPGPSEPVRRVAVATFENRTGEAALDSLGLLVADRVTGLLAQIPLPVVPVSGAPDAVISGSYYRQGASIRIEAQAVAPEAKRVLFAAGPSEGPVEGPSAAVDSLADEIAGHIASFANPLTVQQAYLITLPTLAAYREWAQAQELFLDQDYVRARAHFEKAASLDPEFVIAQEMLILLNLQESRIEGAVELIRKLGARRERMKPYERAMLDSWEARSRGDLVAAHQAVLRENELAPGPFNSMSAAGSALFLNRPTEALAWFEKLDITGRHERIWVTYWAWLADACHMRGEHRRELDAARRGRRQFPQDLGIVGSEVQALAALGDEEAVASRLREAAALRAQESYSYRSPGTVMLIAASELRAHGHERAADSAIAEALGWHRSRADPEPDARRSQDLAEALHSARRWDEERRLLEALRVQSPQDVGYLGRLGVVAAHQGRRDEAEDVSNRLALVRRPFLYGQNVLWRARIAAVLGERDAALRLLRQAFSEGLRHGRWLHVDVDLESVRADPAFRELLEPKG